MQKKKRKAIAPYVAEQMGDLQTLCEWSVKGGAIPVIMINSKTVSEQQRWLSACI